MIDNPNEPIWQESDGNDESVAILFIATGKYIIFWEKFYQSAEKFLLIKNKKQYFVFTDCVDKIIGEDVNVTKIYQEKLGWPNDTLMRFQFFLSIKDRLQQFDHLFFFNANMVFVNKIAANDILPSGSEKLVCALHPCFCDKPRSEFTYDNNPYSLAYIPDDKGQYYFMGGLNGGRSQDYLTMCEQLLNNILIDKSNNVIALWHDESHLNRYMLDRDNLKILGVEFGVPEGWKVQSNGIKIIIQDKSHPRFGRGVEYLRSV